MSDTKIDNVERLINDKGVQFRDFKISNIETREAVDDEPEKMIIEGVPIVYNSRTKLFSYGNTDVFETIAAESMREADVSDVIFNYNHAGRVYARTRNKSLTINELDDGVHIRVELWADDPGHMELYRDIQRGNLDKMSFAFVPDHDKVETIKRTNEETGRTEIDDIVRGITKVYDVSVVDFPAYDATSISARSLIDAVSEKQAAVSEKAESLKRALERYNQIKNKQEV